MTTKTPVFFSTTVKTLCTLWILLWSLPYNAHCRVLSVGKGAEFKTIRSALAKAVTSDTVLLYSQTFYESSLHIRSSITLRGLPGATIDSKNGDSSTVFVEADGVVIQGIVFKNIPMSYVIDNAAVKVLRCKNVTVERCEIRNGFFGVYMDQSSHCKIRFNRMKANHTMESNSGNGVHCWTSRNILVEGNVIEGHRDGIYFEFMHQGTVLNNQSISNLRYGLHFMFSDSCSYRQNVFMKNGAGVAVMFTKYVEMVDNLFKENWGSASYGLLLKDITDSHIDHNRFVGNSIAIHGEGATRILFENNSFTSNGYAIRMLGNCEDNTVVNNSFIGNTFDVTTNSQQSANFFSKNYWSSYDGYDLDKDGFGDIPFHPVRLYSRLVEQLPSSVILMHSLFVTILDLTERIIPTVTPQTLIDARPRMRPLP